jgi:hypothetical protein
VSGDLVGRAVSAVLAPPQAARFAALTGADPGRLVLNVTGWNKLVLARAHAARAALVAPAPPSRGPHHR